VILCNAGICVKDQTAYLRVLAEKQVDGIIMVGSVFSSKEIAHSIRAHLSQTPIVLHNGFIVADNIYSIRTEPQQGIRQVVDHLYNKNHRRIGFVQDYATWSARLKLSAFRQYMLRHGIQGPYDIVQTVPSLEGGRQAARELFQKNTGITAIMTAGDDLTAIGVIKELQAMGKKVPQDIAVTGHNKSLFAAISQPPLTSVDTKMETVGTLLVQTMIQALRGEKPPRVQKIKPELVIRETT
jgi:LacI family transcriptional regulator